MKTTVYGGWRLALKRVAALTAAGLFATFVGLPMEQAAAVDAPQTSIVTDNPYNKTPDVLDEPGSVRYFAQSGNTMVAGGNFTQVRSWGTTTALTRNNLFSFDATTGQVTPGFVPNLDGMVRALVMDPNGTQVYAGGEFKNVNGVKHVSLVKLNLADGSVDPTFKPPTPNGRAFTMRLSGGFLYVGGSFTAVGANTEDGLTRLNPTTGAVDTSFNVPFTGQHHGGTSLVEKIDITPDGTRLAAIGNFTQVAGNDRDQAAMLDLTGPVARVANWETDRYKAQCSGSFNSYVHDVEFSPDGAYFVVVATGAFFSNTLCDAAARFETGATGTALQPTWVNYTGGDTFWSVAITSSAVYVGGHNRWVDNAFSADKPGAGAVYVSGLAALDPVSGVAFDWFPTRTTGVGVFDLYANDQGLWVGHDTDLIGHELHFKLAFFPLAGGKTVPNPSAGGAPSTLYQFGQSGNTVGSPVLYRVNAGGPTVPATDNGPAWSGDTDAAPSPDHNTGTHAETWGTITTVNSTVPTSTPKAIFASDRTGPSASTVTWSVPIAAGRPIEVRLYFANQDQSTKASGQRQFDVTVDGKYTTWGQRTTPYDIVKDVGNKVAVMKAYDTTSDGNVDITFEPHISNAIISGIEIVSICGTGYTSTTANDTITRVPFDGNSSGAPTPVLSTGESWSQARGSFMLAGALYTGWADGHLCTASFDGSTVSGMAPVSLNQAGVNNQFVGELPTVSAMFFSNNRIYYTRTGNSQLFYRPFSPQDNMVGPQSVAVQSSGGNISFGQVTGMYLNGALGGQQYLYFSQSDGTLHRINWNGTATVPFTVINYTTPGVSWKQMGLANFVAGGTVAPNQPPHASVASNCTSVACAFTSAGSGDPDGTIASYLWDFGDGTTSTLQTPSHTYLATGTYTVSLTVTDNQGSTGSASQSISVVKPNIPPTAVMSINCTQLTCQYDGSTSSDSDGSIATYAWNFGDGVNAVGPTASHTYSADNAYTVTLTVTDNQGATGTATQTVNVAGPAAAISFVGANQVTSSGTSWSVNVPSGVAAGDTLLLAATNNTASIPLSAPSGSGWSLVKQAANGALSSAVWEKTAATADAGSAVTVTAPSAANVQLALLAYRGALATNPVTAVAEANETTSRTTHTTPTVTVPTDGSRVVSLWSEKNSSATALTPPATETQRIAACGTGGGHVCGLLTDGNAPVNHGVSVGGRTATSNVAGTVDTMWTIVLGSAAAGPPDVPPTASFTSNCIQLDCTFDGTASSDTDGTIASYAWDFGDGTTDTTTLTPSHSYAAGGSYTVSLTVTDDKGVANTNTQTVTVTAPITGISFVGSDTKDANATSWSVHVPASTLSGDGMVLVATSNSATATLGGPNGVTGWSLLQTLKTASSTTTIWQRVAGAGDAGQAVSLTSSGTLKTNVSLLVYRGTNTTSPVSIFSGTKETISRTTHTTPTVTVPTNDSWVLSIWTDKSSATTALTPPGGENQRTELCGTAAGHVCTLTSDNGIPVAGGTVVGGLTATADSASVVDTMWTLVLGR